MVIGVLSPRAWRRLHRFRRRGVWPVAKARAAGSALPPIMRDVTISDIERLRADAAAARRRVRDGRGRLPRACTIARPGGLWAYLSRMTGSPDLADDLSPGNLLSFSPRPGRLRERRPSPERALPHRDQPRRDGHRRGLRAGSYRCPTGIDTPDSPISRRRGDAERRTDLGRAMARLKPRERADALARLRAGLDPSRHRRHAGGEGRQRSPPALSRSAQAGRIAAAERPPDS